MDTTTLTRPEPHHTESANGRAHLTYYVAEESLAFTWTGMPGHPIEVCHGGDGEPILWRVTVCPNDFTREAAAVDAAAPAGAPRVADLPATYAAPHLFQAVCDRWLTEHYANT